MRSTKTIAPSRRKKRPNSDVFQDLVSVPTIRTPELGAQIEYERIDTPALLSRVDPQVRDSVAVSRASILAKERKLKKRKPLDPSLSQRRWYHDTFRLWLVGVISVVGVGALTFAVLYFLFPAT